VRRPWLGAHRDQAERYLLVTIAAFALTVAGVRWFLEVTGYPKVGGGGLHVAHMLWGGLLLIVAVVLPLLFVGRRVLLLSALGAGVGVGLFIDEVGKFITEENDYFFAPAAPLIYGSLLLLAGLWLAVRRRRSTSAFDAMQSAAEAVGAGLEGRLNEMDRDRVVARLSRARRSHDSSVAMIAERQAAILTSAEMESLLVRPGWIASGRARETLERWLPTRVERVLIVLGLLWSALTAVFAAILLLDVLWVGDPLDLPVPTGPIQVPEDSIWAMLALLVAVGVGAVNGAAAVMIIARRDRTGARIATAAVLVYLVAGGLLTFYIEQFGAVASAVQQLVLLALLVDFGDRLDARHPPRHTGSTHGIDPVPVAGHEDDTESTDALLGAHGSGGL
jgi:hypothetical protein